MEKHNGMFGITPIDDSLTKQSFSQETPSQDGGMTLDERERDQILGQAGLLQIARMTFSEVVAVSLTRGRYRMVQYFDAAALGIPEEGTLEQLLERALSRAVMEDRQAFRDTFFPENLKESVLQGREKASLVYRRMGKDGSWHWLETTVFRQDNPCDDEVILIAVSRGIDEEKNTEARLREQVRQQEEELRITMSQMGNHISYYEVATETLTTLPQTAREFGVPVVMENYPESFIANPPAGYSAETAELLRSFVGAIRRGEPKGACDYPTVTADGRKVWLRREFATIFDDHGQPVRAVISSEDVTEQYEQAHRDAHERRGLLQVAQMMFPEILSVNLTQGTCDVIQSVLETPKDLSLDGFLLSRMEDIAPEDQEAFQKLFFRESQLKAIANGKERFRLTYRRRNAEGAWHWIETIVVRQEDIHGNDIRTFAVSRNVDEQKKQEELLQQALADSAEKLEDWRYYNSLSSLAFPGLIYVNYNDGRPSPYVVGTLAKRLECSPKELALSTCDRIPKEDICALPLAHEKAKQFNEMSFQAEYRVESNTGEMVWVYNHAIRFEDKDGNAGYIHFLTDTTHEHALMDRLMVHMKEQEKEHQKIFQIVAQHSKRILYAYDLATGTTRPWDAESQKNDILSHLYSGSYTDDEVEKNSSVLPDSLNDVKKFFADIHSGIPSGDLIIHIRLTDGQPKWYHFKYSSLFDAGKPTTALISVEDITERHEHELAYLRYMQSIESDAGGALLHVESCLTEDKVEKLSGQMLSPEEKQLRCAHTDLGRLLLIQKFQYEEAEKADRYLSRENLLELYAQGKRQLKSEWKVRFQDGSSRWLDMEIALMEDPYNGRVKAFTRVTDITEKQEERLSILQRADYDAMTGLLRRDAGEERIRKYLEQDSESGGMLIVLDLDDLKGINDTLGHKQGDAAITGISNILKSHFRKDDIVIRAGGDEFVVFLPGAGRNLDTMEVSMTSLLQKLSRVSIGENRELSIHCSAGCAMEETGMDTYDALFKRADTALYHVKRNGKNNFAFYVPEMDQADYEFRAKKLLTSQNIKKFELTELQHLLDSIMKFYQLVLSVNLSANTYYMMEEVKNGVFSRVPAFGSLDGFVQLAAKAVHPNDVDTYLNRVSREALLKAYADGEEKVHCHFQFQADGYRWVESMVIFYTNEQGDVCDFTLLRWADDRANELERMRLQKIMELSYASDFEYICLIDVRSKSYSVFRGNDENSHRVPEFADYDEVTKQIRDTQIPPEDRDTYYKNAVLDHVLAQMDDTDVSYSYRYTLMDGVTREVVFNWYEESHFELLMTVRKIPE